MKKIRKPLPGSRGSAIFLFIFILLALAIAASGYFFYKSYERQTKRAIMRDLYQIADMKAGQVAYWYNDLLRDADVVFRNPMLTAALCSYIKTPVPGSRSDILRWLTVLRENRQYLSVMLVGTDGRILISVDGKDYPLGDYAKSFYPETLTRKQVVLSDLHRVSQFAETHLDLIIPLLLPGEAPVGAMFIRIDPDNSIDMFLNSGLFSSRTAESLILRRENDRAVFLTGLRKQKSPEPVARFKVAGDDPARMVLKGRQGVMEGIDYNGERVLAAVRRVPVPPEWYIVTKIDQGEAYLPIAMRSREAVFAVIAMTAVAGLIIIFSWHRHNLRLRQKEQRLEGELLASEEKYRTCVDLAYDAIFIADAATGVLVDANKQAAKLMGIPVDKIVGLHQSQLHPVEHAESSRKNFKRHLKERGFVTEESIQNSSGEKIPVEISVNEFEVRGKKMVVGIFRDVRERKKVEAALLRYQDSLRFLMNRLSMIGEQERRKLAVDLHDSVAQTLAIAKMKLAELEQEADGVQKQLAAQARSGVDQAIAETRGLVSQISVPVLFELGLEAAVQWLAEETEKKYGLRCAYSDDGRPKPLTEDMRLFLFRSVRELIMNCVKHAQAKNLTIALSEESGSVVIRLEDDGIGFETGSLDQVRDPRSGFGIFSIQEQAKYLGGYFTLESRPGKGTRAVLGAPLAQKGDGDEH